MKTLKTVLSTAFCFLFIHVFAQKNLPIDTLSFPTSKAPSIVKGVTKNGVKYSYSLESYGKKYLLKDNIANKTLYTINRDIDVPPTPELCVLVRQRMENEYFGSRRFRDLQAIANRTCTPFTDCYPSLLCDDRDPYNSGGRIFVTFTRDPDPRLCTPLPCPRIDLNANFYLEQTKSAGEVIYINTVPLKQSGVEHYWGIVYNGKAPNCNCSCEDIPLESIKNGREAGVWAMHINTEGVAESIGIGTNVNAGSSGYGINYKGFPYYGCYKITHYVICGNDAKSYTTCVGQSPTN